MRANSRPTRAFSHGAPRAAEASALLAGCLFAHTVAAQTVTRPLAEAVRNQGVWRYATPRWREDDPDLVRAGVHRTPEESLAEGTTRRDETVVDLDGDGVDERLFTVAPDQDFTPRNPFPGLVVAQRARGGWRARVAFRECAVDSQIQSVAWGVFREGGQPRLALWFDIEGMEENDSGHGHHGVDVRYAVRVLLVDDALRAGVGCTNWSHGWSARQPERWCYGWPDGHATDDCATCDALARGSFVPCDRSIGIVDVRTPAWCPTGARRLGAHTLDTPLREEFMQLR